ncbi:Formamidopyrimidine-DNA glycosylase [Pseudonocardia sp. Ae168_Ps1]|uniref:Fpg/Nei family DNA glycosylase n=1 Tax=unclassified Pseudonocardia TaxID=2619320 RepID=UPI0001FFE92C|nr:MULTISPECIES: DNA-formamidopyrimidine glycosylase family protein [unclassified Pseudonocardia]OLL73559.1 Formamidopyrimidine-DNA glycosylase [Pseudonocardia sp. Ae150A_Ps1]OLL79530.1 Formamidopyrimidine-DNA glycosylase [Pseudonocardia sp. Ae168_Ps1]OLL86329.1 Formamidopyrimidine-DNA glycosylase [Pseudonocardia sp. Ae263_Ps1]OLL93627.1 Formamidopyrimidine-DNA glycosylase [Pseudonocardia sp. Ae356_Ps1]OLM20148.1 Formamidopyrimidine-DNA glycosylase [Pseudonocardia sp. Ae707_Ps1]
MPEGHTLHRLAKRHRSLFVRRPVRVSSPQGRFEGSAALLDGQVMTGAEAHGKHLFHRYGRDRVVHVHLGLYGTFTESELPAPEPVGQLRMRLVGESHYADLRGPTACELITSAEARAVRARLGADPLRRDADPDRVWERVSRSRSPLATLLMDQAVLAGVGNVYRAELLFRHGLDPQLPGRGLDRATWDAMWPDLVALMRDGVRVGRIDTVRPEHDPRRRGEPGRKDRHGGEVYVYRRAGLPCLVCGTEVRHSEHAARNLFWCPTCQPDHR